jgi:cytochrome c biogenesis protein CcdA
MFAIAFGIMFGLAGAVGLIILMLTPTFWKLLLVIGGSLIVIILVIALGIGIYDSRPTPKQNYNFNCIGANSDGTTFWTTSDYPGAKCS